MPEGLYFIAVVLFFLSSLSFFRRLISEVTERISAKLGHIFTYDYYLKNVYYYFLAHWYFIPRGVKTKQIGEISGMVTITIIIIIIIIF